MQIGARGWIGAFLERPKPPSRSHSERQQPPSRFLMSKIKIVCGKCRKIFNEHHSKIRHGLSVTCPTCAQPIVFDNNAKDMNARKALTSARHFRLQASTALT
jgi:hypothetical protein